MRGQGCRHAHGTHPLEEEGDTGAEGDWLRGGRAVDRRRCGVRVLAGTLPVGALG